MSLLVCFRQLKKLKICFEHARPNSLEVFKLICCSIEPSFWEIGGGEFPHLKFLLIKYVHFKALVTEDSSAFPRLKCLQFHLCDDLKNISDDIGDIPTLELIEVMDRGGTTKFCQRYPSSSLHSWSTIQLPIQGGESCEKKEAEGRKDFSNWREEHSN